MVYKCLVFPGVLLALTTFLPIIPLIKLDLPTLGGPIIPRIMRSIGTWSWREAGMGTGGSSSLEEESEDYDLLWAGCEGVMFVTSWIRSPCWVFFFMSRFYKDYQNSSLPIASVNYFPIFHWKYLSKFSFFLLLINLLLLAYQ